MYKLFLLLLLIASCGFINDKGGAAIPLVYDKAAPFSDGLAYFETGDKYGFMDKNGNTAFLLDCDSVSSFKEGLAYFSRGGKYGYIDRTGKTVINPIYDDADYFRDGLAKVRAGLKFGVIDKSGGQIVPADYDGIDFTNGCIIALSGDKWGCFDKNGAALIKPAYDAITPIPEKGSAIVCLGGKCEIVDFKGGVKVPAKYDDLSYYGGEMIEARLNGKIGFLNVSDFSEAIPPSYDYASPFKNGRAAAEIGNKYGVIDEKGNAVVPFDYDYIEIFDNGVLALHKDDKCVLADANGRPVNGKQYDSILTGEYNAVYNSAPPLQNEITPRIKPFNQYTKSGAVRVPSMKYENVWDTVMLSDMNNCSKTFKLYDIDGSGKPVLYFRADGLIRSGPGLLAYSGIYSVKDGNLNELTAGYESSGSIGGNNVGFYLDTQTSKIVIGDSGGYGSFVEGSGGLAIYEYQDGEAKKTFASGLEIREGAPAQYRVNGEPAAEEEYNRAEARYEALPWPL